MWCIDTTPTIVGIGRAQHTFVCTLQSRVCATLLTTNKVSLSLLEMTETGDILCKKTRYTSTDFSYACRKAEKRLKFEIISDIDYTLTEVIL